MKKRYVFLLVLGVIVLCELYIIFILKGIKTTTNNSIQPQITPSHCEYVTQQRPNQALNGNVLDTLKSIKKDVITSSTLINTYTGTIVSIQISPPPQPLGSRARIQIKGTKEVSNLYYNYSNDWDKISVFEKNGTNEKSITIFDLHIDDSIKVEELLDITKDWSIAIQTVKIIKTSL